MTHVDTTGTNSYHGKKETRITFHIFNAKATPMNRCLQVEPYVSAYRYATAWLNRNRSNTDIESIDITYEFMLCEFNESEKNKILLFYFAQSARNAFFKT
jgi:hypothetical protein